MSQNRIYLCLAHMSGNEQKFIQEAFDTNWVVPLGPNVNGFESDLDAFVGENKKTVALSAGTAAVHLALLACGVGPGDEVIVQSFTFCASSHPITYLGATPVFVDSERDTWNMDPAALEKAFEKYPECKVVVVANLYGTPAKLDEICEICERHGAILIEDAAESLSATYKGRQTGTFGKYNAISFNGNKIITTSGGGMLLSDDKDAIAKARFWSTQSREPYPWYEHKEIGYNYRMSNVVAGIGRGQLIHLDEHKALKKKIWETYSEELSGLPITLNPHTEDSDPNYWLSCLLIDEGVSVKPEEIIKRLADENVESRPIWKPMHMQPVFEGCDFISISEKSVGEDIFARGLCLPSDIKMTQEEQKEICSIIRSCFK